MKTYIAFAALAFASHAEALTAYSLGGDAGLGSLTDVVTFDTPNAAGVTETDSGPTGSVGLHSGTSDVAAAPVGDGSTYEAIQPDGLASFDFTNYGPVGALSVYVGSVDAYNTFEVYTNKGDYYYTGENFLTHDGDQSSLETNRRIYFWAAPGQNINSISFGSTGVAFEYDDIAVGAYQPGQGNPPAGAEILLPTSFTAVPEPAAWALMLVGVGGMGASLRSRRRTMLSA